MTSEVRGLSWRRRFLASFCRCEGRGYYYVRGEIIPRERLSPGELAEQMVLGGLSYERVEQHCSKHAPASRPSEDATQGH